MKSAVMIDIEAPLDRVWAEAIDFPSHATWMRDALAIRVEPEGATGVGATLVIDTRVGPFHTTDRFRITQVEPKKLIVGEHFGLFKGQGRFELEALEANRTRFIWREDISFPWFFAGQLGAWVARPILTRIWRSNLKRLREKVEQAG